MSIFLDLLEGAANLLGVGDKIHHWAKRPKIRTQLRPGPGGRKPEMVLEVRITTPAPLSVHEVQIGFVDRRLIRRAFVISPVDLSAAVIRKGERYETPPVTLPIQIEPGQVCVFSIRLTGVRGQLASDGITYDQRMRVGICDHNTRRKYTASDTLSLAPKAQDRSDPTSADDR